MAQNPSVKVVSFEDLAGHYGAIKFQDTLGDYCSDQQSRASAATLHACTPNTLIPFHAILLVFHYIKFMAGSTIINSVHVWPHEQIHMGKLSLLTLTPFLSKAKVSIKCRARELKVSPIGIEPNLVQVVVIDI